MNYLHFSKLQDVNSNPQAPSLEPFIALLLVLLLCAPLEAARRRPVRGQNAMVVSTDPYASDVGVEILKKGGNAVDAAVAIGFALAVVHPAAGNIGGGGFMVIHDAGAGQETTVDYREMAPAAARRDMYQDSEGKVIEDLSTIGYLASGVPGSVAGMHLAWRKFGSLPWTELIEPALRLARDGFTVSYAFNESLRKSAKFLSRFPETRRIFLRDGHFYEEGEMIRQPDLARTLELIAREGSQAFYEGEIARLIAADMQANGGNITLDDLRNYQAKIREPIRGTYRDYEVVSMGPPSSGGVILVEMLNMMERYPVANLGFSSSRLLHLEAEIMRRAFADRAAFLGDPDFAVIPVRGLTSKKYARNRTESIDEAWASLSSTVSAGSPVPDESGQTTHYSVVDKQGNAVAATTTINGGFGSGVTIRGAGFLMNNQMDDFSAKPGVQNMFELIQGEANAISSRKRPLSSMTPTLVKKGGKLYMLTGSPGGPTIMNTVLQVIVNVVDHGMDIQEAVDAPRIHHQWFPDQIVAERGALVRDVEMALQSKGHKIVYRESLGDAHSILIDPATGIRLGAADPRSDSKAGGY